MKLRGDLRRRKMVEGRWGEGSGWVFEEVYGEGFLRKIVGK